MPVLGKVVEKRKVFKRWDDTPRPKDDKRKRPKLQFACDECGTVFTVTESAAEGRRFCSAECAIADKTVPLGVRFNSRWEYMPSGCWEWRGRMNEDGYGTIRDEEGKNVLAHRVSYTLFKGEMPEGMLACHTCRGNRKCVNPAHLYAGSHADNMRDLAIDNTSSFSKTEWAQRREMAERFLKGQDAEVVAKDFGVTGKTVRFWAKRFKENDRVPHASS